MRRIVKTNAPPELLNWIDDNRALNHGYSDLVGTAAHARLKAKLIAEQGCLCAYTGRGIDPGTSHVEHLKPQTACTEWEDVEYRNVVACFPADGGDATYGYGAPVKGGWWVKAEFVSPLMDACERRFHFSWSGHVKPNPEDHLAARTTIEKLGLDCKALRDLRQAHIRGFFGLGARTRGRPLTVADATVALRSIDSVDGQGRLVEFCFVLKQLLQKYIQAGGIDGKAKQ
jgi:uncharacterized protein (TIGR02646 family)